VSLLFTFYRLSFPLPAKGFYSTYFSTVLPQKGQIFTLPRIAPIHSGSRSRRLMAFNLAKKLSSHSDYNHRVPVYRSSGSIAREEIGFRHAALFVPNSRETSHARLRNSDGFWTDLADRVAATVPRSRDFNFTARRRHDELPRSSSFPCRAPARSKDNRTRPPPSSAGPS